MKLELRPLHASFGAEVVGVNLARDLDQETIASVQDAWTRHSLLLFRDVRMTPARHVAFTRRLGPLHVMEPLEFNLPVWPKVFVVSNVEENGKPVGLRRAGPAGTPTERTRPSPMRDRFSTRWRSRPRAATRSSRTPTPPSPPCPRASAA